jgi:hypothetical protein
MNVQPCVNTQMPNGLSLIEPRCLQDERVLAELLAGNGDALAILFESLPSPRL